MSYDNDTNTSRTNNDNEFKKQGLKVIVRNNDINKALRKLKKLLQQEGVLRELREREYYEQPSARRKREKAQARKRWLKKQAETALLK